MKRSYRHEKRRMTEKVTSTLLDPAVVILSSWLKVGWRNEVKILSNYRMRLSMISRIIQTTKVNVIYRSEEVAEVDDIDRGLNNSWYHVRMLFFEHRINQHSFFKIKFWCFNDMLTSLFQIRGTLKNWARFWCVVKPGALVIYKNNKVMIWLTSWWKFERIQKKYKIFLNVGRAS